MLWSVAAPFIKGGEPTWIMAHVDPLAHQFQNSSADYDHDRSREYTSTKQWQDYFRHAWRTWRMNGKGADAPGCICAFPQLAVALGLIKRLTGSNRPIVAWMFNLGKTYGGVKGHLSRFALRGVDTFVVHSRAEIATYSQWLGLPETRFVFVPLSIQMRDINAAENTTQPFVFSMGTANRDYGLLMAAAESLGHRTIIVTGEHVLNGLQIPPNVETHHNLSLEDCHRLCQEARVNVIPIDNDSTASGQVTLLETMMYGKAVVCSECVGTVDYVDNGDTGLMVKAKQLDELTVAIDTLWRDSGKRQHLGTNAKAYIHQKVSFAGVSSEMRRILDALIR